jgi:hypothetical protein
MAQAFNLTAQLNLRGPSNIKTIVADIKRQLGTVQGTINFTIDPKTTRNVSQLESALRSLNTTFTQTQSNATSAANAIRTFNSAIGNISSSTSNINRNMNSAATATQNLGKQTTTAAKQTKAATSEMEEFGKQSALAVRRFAAFSSVTSIIFAFTNALTKGMTAFVAFDKEFVKLQQVTDSSAAQLKGLSDEITSLSKNFGVASSDLMIVASTLAQAGLSAKDTERALKALALTDLAPSFDNMNETVEGSIALMRQFNIGAKDLEKALGAVNSVAAVFAVEASDIITAIQRTGGVFANASKGVSQGTDALNEFIAVFTSVRQTTRESAETIATGLRTIFTRVQRESTIEALKEFGVTLTDLEGKFVGPYEAVKRLSEGLARLDPRDLKFSRIVEELGGFRQIGKVIPLIQQFSVAQEALGVAQRGQGSLAQDAIKAQLSLANQMSKVREEFLALMRDVGNSDTFQAIAKSALGFTSVLIKVADSVKGILPVLAIMGAGKAASGIAQFATGFIGGLKKGPDGQAGGSGGGGGGGIISRMTGGGGNNQSNIGVRELILVSDALRNNTSSLGLNTTAIQDLTRAINNSGRSPFANGGMVRKFARGGVVPGRGNGDTVPAMLQPGEFVIRKKAVETIGADQLHGMNKYGGGGSIRAGRSGSRKRFAKGGAVQIDKIKNIKRVKDGDSFVVDAIPSAEPFEAEFRIAEWDAYETPGSTERSSKTGESKISKEKYETIKGWKRNQSLLEKMKPIGNAYTIPAETTVTSPSGLTAVQAAEKATQLMNQRTKTGDPNELTDLIAQGKKDRYNRLLIKGQGTKLDIPEPLKTGRTFSYNTGGKVQKFMAGGKAKETRSFGSGDFPFPKRISNAYFKEIDAKLNKEQVDKAFSGGSFLEYPEDFRFKVDQAKATESFDSMPFDRKQFADSFKSKLANSAIYRRMSDFAKFIGLPREDLSLALPNHIDFTDLGLRGLGQFDRTGMGTKRTSGYDLSGSGYTEANDQDLYGYEKLVAEKQKEFKKIIKTPVKTFDDGSFSYDEALAKQTWDEINDLQMKISNTKKLKNEAELTAIDQMQATAKTTGRGAITMSTGRLSGRKNDTFYHEMTHQLFQGLRTRSAESFDKYKSRVVSLFDGDNNDLADAFDALESSYNSSDVIYGRSYKVGTLDQIIQQNRSISRGSKPAKTPEAATAASSLWAKSLGIKKAKDFKPLNPEVNQALLDNSISQSYIDRIEDSGKEEFLTTLVQNSPRLDSNLQGALDSTLSELLGSVGIQRQQYAVGGKVERNIGVVDTDVLRDPANSSIVRAAMEKLGITDVSDYTTKLGELSAKARKSGSLSKFRAIAGAAGSGKSSLATGKGANDDASLRKTTRSQILTPEDIDKVNEVIVLTSTGSQSKLDAYLKDVDRAYVLSSNNRSEQDQIRLNRDSRDATGEGLYGRKPGTTRGATADFGLDETILRDELGEKATVLGRKENSFGLRRKKESELPEIIQAGGFYTGGFAPPTRGHRGALDTLLENMLAKNPNASLEDIVVSVAPDLPMIAGKEGIEHAARYGIFPADFRALLSQANFGDAMISTQDQPPGGLPKFMEVAGGDRRKFARLKGAMAITSGKDEGVLGKYSRAGIDVKDIPRIEDISATKVRDALFAGDDKTLTSFLDPNIASVLMGNRAQLRNRSNMVPMLIEEIQKFVDQEKTRSNQEVEHLLQSAPGGPYKNVSAKLKENAPDVVGQIQDIRSQRDRLSRGAFGYRAFNIIRALSAKYPEIYGLDPSRKSSVSAQPSDIAKEAIASQLSEQMTGEFGGAPTGVPSALEEAILQNVTKSTKVDKSSGILPAKAAEVLKRLGGEIIPSDPKFGDFAGKKVSDTAKSGKLPYWISKTDHLMMPPAKETAYTSTRDYLINRFKQSQGTQKATALAETTRAVLSSKQLGLVGLNPLGYSGLLGPETWDLGVDPSGRKVSVDASIIQRGLPNQYQNVIDYLSGQTEELVGGAAKLLGISPKKLSQKERETLGQGNIEGALLEQIFGSAGATVLNDALRTRPIDFPMGIGPKAAKIFGIDPNIPTEVKRTIDSGSRGKAVEEFQRYFRQQYGIPEPTEEAIQKLASGGPVKLYHGSNTGVDDSVLKSFKEKGALSNIAKGYGQGEGFYLYTEKNKAQQQAKMRVGGGSNFTVAQGDRSGKPMVLSFDETLDPKTYDLDYELQKGLVVQWMHDNYDTLKDKYAPTENETGLKGKFDKNPDAGMMSVGVRVQEGSQTLKSEDGTEFTLPGGSRKSIYAGSEGDVREGALLGQLMSRIQSGDPELVNTFESELFKRPLGLALKYVGSKPLNPTNIETFADGGSVEGQKKDKNFGKIGIKNSGSEIIATYLGKKDRSGMVSAKKMADNLYTIGLSKATKGYGPKLYDIVMEAATANGGMLAPDRNIISGAAKDVWSYYFNKRSDVRKTPLDQSQWTQNSALIDPKLLGEKNTWPPYSDPAWTLQSGYSKSPELLNSPDTVNLNDEKYKAFLQSQQLSFFAKGGSVQDTVPALLTPGEFVINKKAAQNIGYGKLKQLNQADKIQGYNKGGYVGIQKFAKGGPLIDVGDDGRKLQENKFLLDAKLAKRQQLNTERSATTDPDKLKSLTEEMEALTKEIDTLGSAVSTAEKEFDSLTDDIEVFTVDAENASKALRESISAELESVTGNKPSEAKIDEMEREALRTGGKVKTDKGDMDFTDRTRDVVNAKNSLESRKQDRESKFGTAKKREDLSTSAKDFISDKKNALRQEEEKKNQLTTKVSTASGGEKILLRDQIAKTDGAIEKLKASIEAAEQAYSITAQKVKEASSAEATAQKEVEDAEQALVDALKGRITDWESLSDERKSKVIEQVRETGQITDKSGKTQSFDNSGVKAADNALEEARNQKGMAESRLEEVSGKSSGAEKAERDVIEAAARRADADAYVALMAKQNGMSVSQFTNKLKKDVGSAFMTLKNDVPKAVGAARASILQNREKLGSNDEATRNIAKQNIQDSLRQAVGSSEASGIDDSKLQAIIDRLADNLSDASMSTNDAIASTDGLSEALAEATSQAQLQARAIEAVSAESGVAADRLEELADGAVDAAQNRARTDEQGRRMQAGLGYAAMGASIVGQVGANMFDPNSREGAVGSAVVGGAGQTAGAGLALASQAAQIPVIGPALAQFVAVGTAAAVVAGAFKDAHNATLEFEKTLANKNLQIAIDKTAAIFEDFNKDIKNVNLLDAAKVQIETQGSMAQRGQDLQNNVPKAFWLNMGDALASSDKKGAADRSKILEKEGITGYLRSTSTFGGEGSKDYTTRKMAEYAPEQAVEQAKTFKPVADATLQLFENKLKTGTSMEDVMKELKSSTVDIAGNIVEAPTQLAKNIALANPNIQELALNIQANNALTEEEKRKAIDNIIAKEAERKATLDLERTLREVEINKLNKATNAYVNSLERIFKQMEASIGRASFELDQLSVSSEAYNAALSGSAKSSQVSLKSMNVLQNSRAYSGSERDAAGKQAGEFFGGTSGNLEGMLKVGDKLENNIISTINRTIQEDPNASEEKIAAKIRTNTESTVQDAGLSKDLSAKLGKEVQKAVTDIRKGGDKGSIGFDELVEKVPALGKTLDGARRAQELANKALEYWQKNLNEYANAMNQSMEMQLEANSLGRKAIDIQNKGSMELQRALGKEVTLREQVSSVLDSTSRQTKGISAPSAIGDNIVKLNDRRTVQQGMSDTAANRGASGKNEFMDMQQRLRNTNMALRENYDALKDMADNTEIASAALAKINEVQQKRQAGVNIAERLVTSSPEELSKLNSAMGRLSNNMAGMQNAGTTSDQRRESLDAFNMISPLLGQDQGAMKANMLESMLGESGVGVSPMMKDVLDSLRNPEEDPMMREAIETYKMGVNLQSDANSELARMNQLMADNTAEVAAEKIAQSLSKVELSFETQIMDDMRKGIRRLVEIEEGKKGDVQNAQGKARGGLIYAAAGQMVDFAPKGTDTVPAMLTPGEFVVNRSATQKNLPLLKNINSNKYSSGGSVKYYNTGGYVTNDNYTNSKGLSGKDRAQNSLQSNTETKETYPVLDSLIKKPPVELLTISGGANVAVDKNKSSALTNWFLTKNSTPPNNINLTPTSMIGPGYDEYKLETGSAANRWAGAAGVTAAGAAVIGATALTGGAAGVAIGGALGASATVGAGITAAGVIGGAAAGAEAWKYSTEQDTKQLRSGDEYISPVGTPIKSPRTSMVGTFLDYSGSLEQKSLPSENIAAYIEQAKQILSLNQANDQRLGGDGSSIKKLKSVIESQKKTIPTPRPELTATDTGATLKGLASPMPKDHYLGLFNRSTAQGISQKDPNLYGFQIGLYDPSVRGWAKLVSGLDNINAMTSDMIANTVPSPESTYFDPSKLSTDQTYSNQLNIFESISAALESLTGGKTSFDESQASLNNKRYVKDIEELYRGSKLSAVFENREVVDIPDAIYPVTAFGKSFSKWNDIKDIAKNINGGKFSDNAGAYLKLTEKDSADKPIGDAQELPWLDSIIAQNQQIQDIIDGQQAEFMADPTKANVFDSGSGVVDNGRYKFTYQKLKSKFFNDTARRFMGDQQDFIVVRNQAKESAGLNPFSDLGENQNIYVPGHDIETLIAELDKRNGEYGTPFAGQSGTPGSKPEDVVPYRYKLKQILKADNTGDLVGIEKSWAFKSDGSTNGPGLSEIDLIAKSYTLAREQELLTGGLSEDKADVKKIFRVEDRDKKAARERKPGESDADYEARMKTVKADAKAQAKEEAWTEAKRVTLGRAIYGVANQNGLKFNSPLPVSVPTVGGVAVELGQYMTKMPTDSPQRAVLDSYRAFFAELYNNGETAKSSKEAAEGSDSGSFLKSLGIDISDKAFGGPGPMTKVPGSTTETRPAYYTSTTNDAAKINAILARQFMAERSKQFAGALSDEKKEELTVDTSGGGAKIYTVNPDGTKSLRKGDEIVPKSYADIFDMALTPENLFPDSDIRQQYLDQLISYYSTAADAKGQALFSSQMSQPFIDNLNVLKSWYKVQDTLLNGSRSPEQLLAIRGGLQAIQDGNISDSLQKQFEETTGLTVDAVKTQAEQARETAQKANAFLTTNKYGELPDLERMISLLNVQAAEKAQEDKQQQSQQLSSGGVVYASTGKLINFQPRGTDTVPAMLTPGEFVVNRGATQKHLPVLEAINSGNYSRGDIVQHLSRGGVASGYYQVGGPASAGLAGFDFSSFMNDLVGQVSSAITEAAKSAFDSLAKSNTSSGGVSNSGSQNFDGISEFTNKLDRISSTLASLDIPKEITITGKHDVNVIINGDQALSQLTPNIKDMVMTELKKGFERLVAINNPVPSDSLKSPYS